MLHDIRVPEARCLSDGERVTLAAIAEAVMPAGQRFPGADGRTVARMEGYLAQVGDRARLGVRALLGMVDASSYARHLRPFARLSADRRTALLESWRTGSYLRRMALRALTMPLKIAHFDDPAFFRAIGCVYEHDGGAAADKPRWM